MLQLRWLAVAVVVVAAMGFAACGDDDEEGGETTAVADIDRFCELTKQLDQAGTEAFEELEQDPEATREDFEQAEAEFLQEHEAELDEIQQVAPEEIQNEIQVVIAGTRGRAGLEENPPEQQEERAAEEAIRQFERENCDTSGES
jgi:hypothetical protein